MFTKALLLAKSIYPKKCLIFDNIKLATKQQKWQNILKYTQNNEFLLKHTNISLNTPLKYNFLYFQEVLTKKTQKLWNLIQFTTKHHMLIFKCYPSPDNFGQALFVMLVTFRKSDLQAVAWNFLWLKYTKKLQYIYHY